MTITSAFKYIESMKAAIPQLSHASNIISKFYNKKNEREENVLAALIPEYAKYLKSMLDITTYDRGAIDQKTNCLNAYYDFMHKGDAVGSYDFCFSSQGKFRPTILEEFLFLLFKDYLQALKQDKDTNNVLSSGSVKAYSNIYFKAKNLEDFLQSPEIGVNEKDQDFAIFRAFNVSINDRKAMKVNIPAIAMEAKTYIDKTMLDTIIATAEKLKNGNPHTRFIAVAERYEVSLDVDPAYSRIDQIYILRKALKKADWATKWLPIDKDVVWRLFSETIHHFERPWSDIGTRLSTEGVIL